MAKTYNQIKKSILGKNYDINRNNDKVEKTYAEIKSGVKAGKYNFSSLKSELENKIRFDTFASDLSSMGKTIGDISMNWQSQETMNSTRSSMESMQERLRAFKEYQSLFGDKETVTEVSKIQNSYRTALDGWEDLSKNYSKYKNADAFTSERTTLNNLYGMNSSDVKKAQEDLEVKLSKASEYQQNVKNLTKNSMNIRNPSAAKSFSETVQKAINERDNYLKSIGYESYDDLERASKVAYTTADGYNIKWQDLYDDANLSEYTKKIVESPDFANTNGYKKKDVNYTYHMGYGVYDNEFGHIYNLINDDKDAQQYETLGNVNQYNTSDSLRYKYFTPDEKKVFNHLAETQGEEKALEYAELLSSDLRQRRVEHENDTTKRVAENSPIGTSILSVISNVGNNAMALPLMAMDYAEDGSIDENSSLYTGRRQVQTTRNTVENMIDNDVGKFFYRHGMNTADNIAAMAVSGFGKLGVASKVIQQGIMSSGAVVDTAIDAKSRGVSDGDALALGMIAGAAEWAFESRSFDALFDTKTLKRSGWEYFVNSLKTEVVGELGTELTNDVADVLLSKDLSQWRTDINSYLASGMSEKEAFSKAFKEAGLRYLDVAAGALFSTGIISGTPAVVGSARQHSYNKAIGRDIKANERTGDMFDLVSDPEVASAYEVYTNYAKKGINAENISDAKLGRLHTNATLDAQDVLDSKESTVEQREAAQNTLDKLKVYSQTNMASRTGSATNIDKDYLNEYDAEAIVNLIESGLESGEDTDAYRIATEYKSKIKNYENLAQVVEKKMSLEEGETLTEEETKLLEESKTKLSAKDIALLSDANDRAIRTEESNDMATKLVEKGESKEIADIVARKMRGEALTSEEAEKVLESEVALSVIAETKNSENATGEILENAKGMEKEKGALYVALYDGKTDVDAYTNAFNLVATKAERNFSFDDILKHRNVLSTEQISQIYKDVRIKADQNQRIEFQKLIEKTANLTSYKGDIDDSVIDYENTSAEGKVNWNDLNERQRKSITIVKGLAQATGMNLELIKNGKERGFHGAFSVDGNTIILDVYAGIDINKNELFDTIIPTVSHELTHWMEKKSPILFRKINDLVFSTLKKADGLTESERISKEITNTLAKEYRKKFEKNNPGKTITLEKAKKQISKDELAEALDNDKRIEVARSEIIARACEDMLSRSKAGRELFNSLSESDKKTLVDKVKDIIQNIKDWVSEALGLYKSKSYEAMLLRDYQEEVEKLSALWDEMLTESVEVNQALEKSGAFGHTNATDGDVLKQAREIDANGNSYWQIETDKDIFKGITTVKGLQKAAYNYILNGDKGNVITALIDGEELRFIRVSAEEYVYGKASKKLSEEEYKQKMRMATSIIDLVENASIQYDAPDHKNHKLFANGFKNYQGRVGIDETIFRYIVRVGKAKNGKIFYDINLEVDVRVPRANKSSSPIKMSTSEDSISNPNGEVKENISDNESASRELAKAGLQIDDKGESIAPDVLMSERTWTESEYVQDRETAINAIVKALDVSKKDAKRYVDNINSIARMISDDRTRLDYEQNIDENASALKTNKEYKWTVDMSTLCAKRLLFTGTFDAIQKKLPNTVFNSEDIVALRSMMMERGYEVACGICYVESTRRELGPITAEFIERYKLAQKNGTPISKINSEGKEVILQEKGTKRSFYTEDGYIPTLAELNTTDIDLVKRDHPEVYAAYLSFMKSRGQAIPKLLETRTEYKGEILKHFKSKSAVKSRNDAGGLRVQSFSDFEVAHLIDMMQIVLDMSRVGLMSQAYTKVPAFADVFGNTGIKINLSLIAKGSGLDANGNLIFDDVEGMPHKEAFRLRDKYSKNVGTILVGKNDAHIRTALADSRIDFVIPFHKSFWKESLYEALGLTGYEDYTDTQNEKPFDKNRKIKNFQPSEYWDYSKSGEENAKTYLKMCADDERIPKFPQFQNCEGYWKLLIDFKMYDNDGVGSPQMTVKPNFSMDEANSIMKSYEGGHREFPVAQDVVDAFVKNYEGRNDILYADRETDIIEDNTKDMRFSMRDNVEETRDLVAVHNMQVSELERTLDLGGLPMPSIAIIKAKSGHNEYGDVSLVFPKSTIDPKADRNNKVYGGDAWTPVYPKIEYKPNKKIAQKISDKYYELSRKYGYDESRPLYNFVYDLEEQLNRNNGETDLIEELYDNQNMMQLYLLDSGKGKVETIQKEIRTELTDAEVEMNEFFIKELGADVVDEVMWDGNGTPMSYRKNYLSKYEDAIREAYKKLLSEEYHFTDEQVQNVMDSTKAINLLNFMRDAHKYRENGRVTIKTEDDFDATKEAIKNEAGEGYRKWIDSLFKGIEEKSGIRNNVDYFTNSGNRRSWEALHWENNLENVVKVMKAQDNGVAFFSGQAIWGVSAKDYRSIEEIKADADRLKQLPEEEYNAIKEGFGERLQEIAHSIMDKSERNPFIASDNAMECIVDALRNSKTKSGVLNYLRQFKHLTVTETNVADIVSLVADISNMPTEYFEAKPKRAVELNEIATAIIPDSTSEDTKSRLDNMGIKYLEYESGNEDARLDALNSLEDLRFSERDDVGYHAGDLGKSEFLSQQGKYRDTGHFGTGTYFVGDKELVKDYNKRDGVPAPQHAVDFSNYNLYKVKNDKDGAALHNQLHIIDGGIKKEWIEAAQKDAFSLYKSTEYYAIAKEKFGEENKYTDKALIYGLTELAKKANIEIPTKEQYSKESGYDLTEKYFDRMYREHLVEVVDEKINDINEEYAKFRDAYSDLKLRFGFKGQVYNAMKKVLEYQNANPSETRYAHRKDSLATVFMKSLGYEGIDVRGTKLDNVAYGSVIYDLKEDTILYSEREDTSTYDIMGEKERLIKEKEKFKADFERLKERLEIEKKVTKGTVLNDSHILNAAGHLRNISNSTIDKVELARSLKEVYSFIRNTENVDIEDVYIKCCRVAESILDKAKPDVIGDEYYKTILKDIRNSRISLSESQKKEAANIFDKHWNRYFFGRVNITDSGVPIESQWQEWSSLYPNLFKEDISDGDMIGELYDILNNLKKASETVVEYDKVEKITWMANEIYNQYWNVSPIKTTADKYEDKIKKLNFEHRKAMAELRDAYNERVKKQKIADDIHYGKIINKLKTKKESEIALAKEHGKVMLNKYKENAERKTRIQRISSNALSLNELLIKNSKDKHVPEIMKGPVTTLLQAIDFSSKRLIDSGIPTQKDISLSKALSKVKDMMVKATNAHEELVELYGHGLDEDIENMVDSVDVIMRTVGDNEFVLNKMSVADLQTLDKVVKTIRYAVNKLNEFHTVNHAKGIANLSQESVFYLNKLGKAKIYDGMRGKAQKTLNWGNALPYYAFKRYGSGGMKVYEALQDGWDKFAFNTKRIIDYADETYTAKEVKEWSKEVKTFKVLVPANENEKSNENYEPQYQEVQLTVPQIMSMYCLAKREQARGHLFQGGVRVADFKDKNGKIVSQTEGLIFTENDVQSIFDSLTSRQKEVADKLQAFMNDDCTKWGNEVSMARFGYKAFGEENYFPIQSDKNNLAVNDETEQINSLFKLLNMSFTKSVTENANNRIVISDIFDVFAQHTSDMAKYNALALPVLDAFKWYNYTEKQDVAEGTFKTQGVKQSIENAFGKDGQNYFTTFLKDINGQQAVSRDTLGNGFFSNAKIAAVGANLRVVALQPTSYVRASAIIDNKYLTKALMHKPKTKKAETYCGIALWKSMGYYDTNIQKGVEAQIKHADTWKDKATDWSMKGAEVADKITWGYLWNACELEIRDTRKDLEVGSKEFYEAIGKRLREVIYATQVVDSTMTRSQMMRSSDGKDKMLTAFASEPTLSYNLIQDAYMQFSLDARQMGKKEAFKKNGKRIARVVMAYTMTNIVAAIVESGFDVLRDDDEEIDIISFMNAFLSNFASDMSITAKIPYVKELHSIIKGFSSSRTDTQWMEGMTKSIKAWYKIFNGKGNPSSAIKYSLKALSDVSGLAFYNVYRDVMATLNKIDLFTADDLNEMFGVDSK